MKTVTAMLSIVFGFIACLLVFTGYFKTPPLAITIFSLLGIVSGLIGRKKLKVGGIIGIVLSAIALIYLIFLFVDLGG